MVSLKPKLWFQTAHQRSNSQALRRDAFIFFKRADGTIGLLLVYPFAEVSMNKGQLDLISKEISEIEQELYVLDPTNSFENRRADVLNFRLEALDIELDRALVHVKRNRLSIVRATDGAYEMPSAELA
jgi:hypothetical protein